MNNSKKLDDSTGYIEFAVKPLGEADLREVKYVRELYNRAVSVSTSSSENARSGINHLVIRILSHLIKFMKHKLAKSLTIKSSILKIFWRLPFSARQAILEAWAPKVNSFKGTKISYSFDIGIGIPTSSDPLVSLIIPVHNNWYTTLDCLRALIKNTDATKYEIIVVDDASTDQTPEALDVIRGIRVIRVAKNVGYLKATNLGAKFSNAKYLVLLNNDTEPVSGWLDSLVEVLEEREDVAIAGSALIYPDGLLQEAGSQIFSNGNAWNLGRNQDPRGDEFRFTREVDYCSAASIIVRRAFWEEINGFDERYQPAYCEDSDLCLQAWSKGYKVVYVPTSWVIHYEGVSHGNSVNSGIKKYQVENNEKLKSKWQDTLKNHWNDNGLPRIEYQRDSKGIVILLDRQLPSSTRDAGSIRTIQLIRHIQDKGFHVILSAMDNSTSEYDVEYLRKSGVEVHLNEARLMDNIKLRSSRIRYVWISRAEVFKHYFPEIQKVAPHADYIADLVDLDYKVISDGNIEISSLQLEVIKSANQVVLVSEVEKELLSSHRELHKEIKVLWAEYEPSPRNPEWHNANGLIFVGGFRHLPNLEGLTWFASEVLPELRKAGFLDRVNVIGSGLTLEQKALLTEKGLSLLGRQENLEEFYLQSRIAILPLLNGRGLKGKMGEALSYGIPVVTTLIGAEGFNFKDEVLIATTVKEWVDAIVKVYNDEKIWRDLQQAGLNYARLNLSTRAFGEKLDALVGDSHGL